MKKIGDKADTVIYSIRSAIVNAQDDFRAAVDSAMKKERERKENE